MSDPRAGQPERRPLAIGRTGPAGEQAMRPAAFLDRDGVLNEMLPDPVSGAPESPLAVADVRLCGGAVEGARRLAQAGYALVCVSNQPAAAKGKVSVPELLAIHDRVLGLLAAGGVRIEASRLCLHHPEGIIAGLAGGCGCRKPAPGMLLDAAAALNLDLAASWMLGDTDTDVQAGEAAGTRTVLIEYPGSAHKRAGSLPPRLRAPDLAAAAAQVIAEDGR